MNLLGKKQRLEQIRSEMELERSSFIIHWRDLGDYINPRRARFFLSDVNRGDRRSNKIIDNTATTASRTLRSGMMSGITSQARPWFNLTTPDPDLSDFAPVKQWLHVVTERMRATLSRSNFYHRLNGLYGDLGDFGTSALLMEEDQDDVITTSLIPIGSFCIATDHKGRVNGFSRVISMSVNQIVTRFAQQDPNTGSADWSNISSYVKNLYDNSNYQSRVDVVHVIMPNWEYRPNALLSKHKRYMSCYYELGGGSSGTKPVAYQNDVFLRESGYDYFPVFAPRWEVTGEDDYATNCPGMTVLGDARALQLMHKRKSQGIEKMVNPPMVAPTDMRSVASSIIPGGVTYFDETTDKKFRPVHDVNIPLQFLLQDIQEHQYRIKKGYYEDVMLMFSDSDRRQITAREIEERGSEKFVVLGPVLENLNVDLLNPVIDTTFYHMRRHDLIPPPPEEIQGLNLKIEYVSVMAQAQKLIGLGSIERFTGFLGTVAQFDPKVLRKYNSFEAINVVADMTSVPPKIVVPDDEAIATQQRMEQAAAQAQQAEVMSQQAASAKQLSETKLDTDNVLTRLFQRQGSV